MRLREAPHNSTAHTIIGNFLRQGTQMKCQKKAKQKNNKTPHWAALV